MANKETTVAEGVTAASGTLSGVIIGVGLGGPAGAAIGAVIGAAAGAAVGYGLARGMEPAEEDAYWRGAFGSRPYVKAGATYEDYRDAYEYGWESAGHDHRTFEEAEADLEAGWKADTTATTPGWDEVREAVRDAWHHVERRHGVDGEDEQGASA